MQNKYFEDVGAFHAKFGLEIHEPNVPVVPSDEMLSFRLNFLLEELSELAAANDFILNVDADSDAKFVKMSPEIREDMPHPEKLEHSLDALVDLLYVLVGTARVMGLHTVGPSGNRFDEAWRRVQQANMAKVRVARPEDSKRGSGYDITKPEGWVAPKLRDLVL